ncbi:MAG: T9SS type A sorting domain-containing protein [Calditrichaeota bacterium]|nr:T9SS type A sorting domain-containing protein [Calditrichota bacterium]
MKYFKTIMSWYILFTSILYAQMGTTSLLLPVNNSQNNSVDSAYFEWSPVDSAEFYEIYIDDHSDFTTLVHEEIVYGFSKEVNGLFSNWNFYWKVRAGKENESGEQEFGEWSETNTFISKFEQAENYSPLDGSIDEEYLNLELEWELLLDPTVEEGNNYYLVQVSTDAQFTNVVFGENIENAKTTVLKDLDQDSDYFWRVKYSNDFGESDWSEVTQFKTKQASLDQVNLQSPENVTTDLSPISIDFVWQSVIGAEGYVFEIATDSSFNNVVESASVVETQYSTSLLHFNETLYWHVQAERGTEKSLWSKKWKFTTSKAAPQTPPGLISPVDSLNYLDLQNLNFRWSNVYGAENYLLQIAHDNHFVDVIFDSTLIDTEFVVIDLFEDNKKYYWRVMGLNDQGDGPWSNKQNFSFGNVTHINDKAITRDSYQLLKNYPNPFNPSTTIEFTVQEHSHVILSIYDLLGQKIKTLENTYFKNGTYKSLWDGTNNFGDQTSSGVFFYRIEISGLQSEEKVVITKRMLKIK